MADTWFNADGLVVDFARSRKILTNRPFAVKTYGATTEVHLKFDLSLITATEETFTTDRDNDGTNDGFNSGDFYIPDQAFLESAEIYMTDTAAAGGTSVAAGTYEVDGTAIDADGLVTATEGVTADLAANDKLVGTGAQVGTAVTQKAYVALVTAGTFTAGKGTLVIKYTRPQYV